MTVPPVRVLIVDDSASVRLALAGLLASDPRIKVIGMASDPFVAAEMMRKQVPDVITLDIEMPRMDGLTFLAKLMEQHPLPVVICSNLADSGSKSALAALEAGAVAVVCQPKVGTPREWTDAQMHLCDAVCAAARVRVRSKANTDRARHAAPAHARESGPKLTADAVIAPPRKGAMVETTERIIAIGASTGGTEAILTVLRTMPVDCPGIVIVQHMPEKFTTQYAERLDSLCDITVREAKSGDSVLRGQALLAPGGRHLLLKRSGSRYHIEVADGPMVSRHRPSVDVLFRSTARYAGANAIGVILTGMGDDGAQGMFEMFEAGAYTIAQDEATCVVYGMPAEAMKRGAVHAQVALERVTGEALRAARSRHAPS